MLCPTFASAPPTHSYSLRSLKNDPLLLSSSIQNNSLGLLEEAFLVQSQIYEQPLAPLDIRLMGSEEGWSAVLKLLQRCSLRFNYKKNNLMNLQLLTSTNSLIISCSSINLRRGQVVLQNLIVHNICNLL